jgi:hypothetical protein
MSIETTKARSVALYAGSRWMQHCNDCARCSDSVKRGSHSTPCRQGLPLWLAHVTAEKALTFIIRLDKLPAPGQDALF